MAEHATAHRLPSMRLILHGGEPLLAGRKRLASLVASFRAEMGQSCRLDVRMQTNGVLLDEKTLATLAEQQVSIGVSLDGTPTSNDRRRQHVNGRGSSAAVDRALHLLGQSAYRHAFAGILCTVDPSTEPIPCYETLLAYRPRMIDFLLPHANWSTPLPFDKGTPYADWLIQIFDRWYSAPRQETSIRLFEDIIVLVLGAAAQSEQVGLSPVAVVVVESDGAIELVDSLKSTYPGACTTGLRIDTDALDRALWHPGVVARQLGLAALCDTCRSCRLHTVCGGGHYVHRYRAGEGFLNPSVYCADMFRLIEHIKQRVTADLRRRASETRS